MELSSVLLLSGSEGFTSLRQFLPHRFVMFALTMAGGFTSFGLVALFFAFTSILVAAASFSEKGGERKRWGDKREVRIREGKEVHLSVCGSMREPVTF